MRKALIFISSAVLFLAGTAFTIQAILNWQIDSANAKVKFEMKGTKGMFTGVKGDIKFDADSLTASYINCTIDISTINTGSDGRDKHLRSPDFFDAAKYPVATFRSSKIEKDGAGFKATGDLTIRQVTKPVIITFTFDNNNGKGVFKGAAVFYRNDYGIGEAAIGHWGVTEPEPVNISFEIPVEKQ
jgi:polyisoprenoid-binding protein YceI